MPIVDNDGSHTYSLSELDDLKFQQRMIGADAPERNVRLLQSPFRNADLKDWQWLMNHLGQSGHGQFWRDVMKGALELTAPTEVTPEK